MRCRGSTGTERDHGTLLRRQPRRRHFAACDRLDHHRGGFIFFGFNPANLYDAFLRLWDWISSLGLDAVKRVLRYLLLGAIIVVPLWLLSRVFSYLGPRRGKQG